MENDYENITAEVGHLEIDAEPPELIGGVGFGLILFFAITKDILDVFFLLFSLAMAATGVGIVVTVIISAISFLISLIVFLLIWFYFFYKRVKITTKVLIRIVVAALDAFIPIFKVLPMSTFTVVSIRGLENTRRKHKFVDQAVDVIVALSGRH